MHLLSEFESGVHRDIVDEAVSTGDGSIHTLSSSVTPGKENEVGASETPQRVKYIYVHSCMYVYPA